MSPLELRREFEADRLRQEREHHRDVTIAWMVAGLSRQDRLPKLESLLRPNSPQGRTREDMVRAMKAFSERYSIPLKTKVH